MSEIKVICDAHEELRKIFLELERIEPRKIFNREDYKETVDEIIKDWKPILETAVQMGIRMKLALEQHKKEG